MSFFDHANAEVGLQQNGKAGGDGMGWVDAGADGSAFGGSGNGYDGLGSGNGYGDAMGHTGQTGGDNTDNTSVGNITISI